MGCPPDAALPERCRITDVSNMEGNSEAHVAAIREQIERGSYEVDPKAVADAILRRLCGSSRAPAWRPVRFRTDVRSRQAPRRNRGN